MRRRLRGGSRDSAGCVGTLDRMSDPGAESPSRPPTTRRQRRTERVRRRRRQRLFALAGAAVVAVATVAAWQLGGSGDDGAAAPPPSSVTRSTTTTTTIAPLAPPYSQAIADENAKPGTTNWRLTHDGATHDMEGYLNVTSAQRGDTVTLYATTVAPS